MLGGSAPGCRITGPGAEYGGEANTTKSGDACLRWTDASVIAAAADSRFPDGGRAAAGNRCRNPTGDPGGPWCYVAVDGATVADYCETFDCNDDGNGGCGWTLINGGGDDDHGHYTSTTAASAGDGDQAGFELRAWDPAGGRGRPFRVSLTAYPIGPGDDRGFHVPVPADAFARSPAQPVRVNVSWRNGVVVLTRVGRPSRELLSFRLNATVPPVAYVSFVAGDPRAPVAVRFTECDRTAGQVQQDQQ